MRIKCMRNLLLHTLLITAFVITLLGTDAESRFLLSNLGTKFAVHLITQLFIPIIITLTDGTKQLTKDSAESRGGVMLGSITLTVLCVIKLHRRFHDNILNTTELFIILQRNIRCFLFVIQR